MRRALRLTAVFLLCIGSAECRPVMRYRSSVPRNGPPAAEPGRGLNAELLTDLLTRRVEIEVDWVEGYRPTDRAIETLRVAFGETAPGRVFQILLDDELPWEEWARSPAGYPGAVAFASDALDADPRRSEVSVVHVLYVPDGQRWFAISPFGLTTPIPTELDGVISGVPTVFLFTDTLRKGAVLWITVAKAERSTLVHEFGHVLGLVSDPRHGQRRSPRHCTEPDCVMAGPRKKVILYNFLPALFAGRIPTAYCRRCRADLAAAREAWASEAERDPGFATRLRRGTQRRDSMLAAEWYGYGGRADEAVEALATAEREARDDSEGEAELAWALRSFGRFTEAAEAFERANALPGKGMDYSIYGWEALLRDHRFSAVLEQCERRDPSTRDAPRFVDLNATALSALGRHDEAIELYRKVLREPNLDVGVRRWFERRLAWVLLRSGRSDEAKLLARSWLRDDPKSFDTRLSLARILLAAGERSEAASLLRDLASEARRSIDRRPNAANSHLYLSEVLSLEGSREEALEALDRAVGTGGLHPGRASAARAGILAAFGDAAGAADGLEGATRHGKAPFVDPCLDPDFLPVRGVSPFRERFRCDEVAAAARED